jgi:hypothetical protein
VGPDPNGPEPTIASRLSEWAGRPAAPDEEQSSGIRSHGGWIGAGSDPVAGASGPSAGSLAIPGYDSLAASQVVQRLAGLSQEELEEVGAYEAAHRSRRTILSRIRQLQGS